MFKGCWALVIENTPRVEKNAFIYDRIKRSEKSNFRLTYIEPQSAGFLPGVDFRSNWNKYTNINLEHKIKRTKVEWYNHVEVFKLRRSEHQYTITEQKL